MKSPLITWWIVAASGLLLGACSRDQPSAPTPHSITGRVILTGRLVGGDGMPAGTRQVDDADDVRVELAYGDRIVAQTTTVDGVYRFSGIGPGGYVARTRLIGSVADQTRPLTISRFDIIVADTLHLASQGDLVPVPNPIVETTTIYFELSEPTLIHLKVLDLSGNTVRTLISDQLPSGLQRVGWDGLRDDGQPASGPLYWVTLDAGFDVRAALLFK